MNPGSVILPLYHKLLRVFLVKIFNFPLKQLRFPFSSPHSTLILCPSSSVERSPRLLSSPSLTVSLPTVLSLFFTVTHSSHDSLLSRHPLVYSNLLHSRVWRRQEGWHTVAFLSRLGCIQKPPTKSVMKPPPGGAKAPGAPSPAAPSPAPGGEKKEVR